MDWLLDRFLSCADEKAVVYKDKITTYNQMYNYVCEWKDIIYFSNVPKGAVVSVEGESSPWVMAAIIALIENKNIIITDPLGYLEFMGIQKKAKCIITDSGGVQEESTYFGVPCFTVRDNTERPITIDLGTNILAGTDFKKLPDMVLDYINVPDKKYLIPEYWDGKSSERIANILSNY